MKRILVLGSTGSIGVQALEVIDAAPDMVACGLACARRVDLMGAQAAAHAVEHTVCAAGGGTLEHEEDLASLIDRSAPDMVLNALVGAAGLRPTLAALERGIDVALANKESLVVGGELVRAVRHRTGARLVPVDSEHSALFQLLEGVPSERVVSAILTASGGPFRGRSASELERVGVGDALSHPTWSMGAKITIDSATLMNKGLEVIEAHHLFDLPYDRIEVLVHPQSLIHALVRLDDGSVLAHCGPPDMRVPIGHALRHPAPPPAREPIDLVGRRIEFEAPDEETFPCLALARAAGAAGGTAPAILNAANEVAVAAFLAGRLPFPGIARAVADALDALEGGPADDLETVLDADRRAREHTENRLAEVAGWSA
ncbi:MAG TPA: 1-deoxy-D-xylulose-5-phosphate reductoisomerase [Miltoncostaeaceae bacterium]|nr:1-deoxy-D-xylulose-5-phosphate reductoisomerase [Miltoncostaeaceae bacterium]